MTFFTFPSATILIVGIVWLNLGEAIFTDENPAAILFDANSIKGVLPQSTGRAILLPNSFYLGHEMYLLSDGLGDWQLEIHSRIGGILPPVGGRMPPLR